jgi:Ca-activated chloride channel family protein
MKLVFCFSGFFLLSVSSSVYSFSYDSAVYAAQKGNWEDAHAALNNIITNKPDNADVVYDAGVAAYNLGNASQARACFTRATELACHDNKNLCFRAHFNAGNACVDDKDLKCALEHYDKALVIEPDNEHARHNRDRVAQMLEQEKQQDQQKKDDQKKEDKKDKQDNKDQQDQQDQQKQNQEGDDQQDSDQSGGQKDKQQGNDQPSDQSSEASAKDGVSNQQSQGEQGDGAEQGDKNAQRKDHGNKEQQQKKSADNKERNGDNEFDKKTDGTQSERDKQQGSQHNKTPEKQNTTKDNKANVPGEGTQAQAKDEDGYGEIAINDPWLLNVLNNQELQDKAINKQLMEAKVRQHGGGKNAKNCW